MMRSETSARRAYRLILNRVKREPIEATEYRVLTGAPYTVSIVLANHISATLFVPGGCSGHDDGWYFRIIHCPRGIGRFDTLKTGAMESDADDPAIIADWMLGLIRDWRAGR